MKTGTMRRTDRVHVLRQAIWACRKGGTISVPGVYIGTADMLPIGALMNKGITLKTGQTHMQKYMPILLERIQNGDIDPSFIITHKVSLRDAPMMYHTFKHKMDGCIKVVLK